ncbi:MAG: PAS domain S-box protein [Syntrophobacteraceae bacterium]
MVRVKGQAGSMRFSFTRNLRFRLITLLCIAIAPAVCLISYNLYKQHLSVGEAVQKDLHRLVQIAESEYYRSIENVRQILFLLSHVPEASAQHGTDNNTLLSRVKNSYPHITHVALLDPSGKLLRGELPQGSPSSGSEYTCFQRSHQTGRFALGDYQAGGTNSGAHVGAALPIYGEAGDVRFVVFAGIDLTWFNDLFSRIHLPEGWVITLQDRNGIVIARHPGGDKWLGNSAPVAPAIEIMQKDRRGARKSAGADGAEWIHAFSALSGSPEGGGAFLSIGVPTALVCSEVRRSLIFWIASLLAVIFLAFSAMAVGSNLFILSRVKTLIESTRQLCDRNLSVRTGLCHSDGELGQLAGAFDQMAESLEFHEIARQHSQAALVESEHRFRTIFDSVNDAILVHNPSTGAILDVNQRMCELFGYPREVALQLSIADLSSGEEPYTSEQAMERLKKAVRGEPEQVEWHSKNSAGELFWSEVNLRGAMIGGRSRVLVTIRDISARKRAEIALRQSEARYRAFIANSSEGIFRIELRDPVPICLPAGEQVERLFSCAFIEECNDFMARSYGLESARDIIGSRLADYMSPSDAENVGFLINFIQSGYRLIDVELHEKDRYENELCLLKSLMGVIEDGRLVRIWGVQRDITDQKRAEEKMLFLNQFNREIISSARNGIIVYDLQLNYAVWNQFMEEWTGLPARSIIGINALELFPHIREQGIDLLMKKALGGESCLSNEIRFTVPQTGSEIWMIGNYGPHYNALGEIIGVIEIATDISRLKMAEEELQRLSRRNHLILDAAGEGIIGLNVLGEVVFANPASTQMLHFEPEELFGKSLHTLIHHSRPDGAKYPQEECPMYQTLVSGFPSHVRSEVLWRKDGQSFPAVYSTTPIVENGEVTGAVITFRDVTDQRQEAEARARLEAQLRQAQKMQAIGTLAGGIAHDFNNILMPIIGYCELALSESQNNAKVHRMIDQVLKSSIRAKDLVKQILSFSRKDEQEPKPVQVSLIVKEVLHLLRSSLPTNIEVQRQIDPDAASGAVMAHPTQIHQILMNLCTNAAHAMGERGGALKIKLSSEETHVWESWGSANLAPGSYLRLSISDTGCGIDEEAQQRIFEPYFTTKDPSKGTGLGLSVVYGIVNNLGGEISFSSSAGRGTSFHILLPRVEPDEIIPAHPSENQPTGSGYILLVDDEKDVLDLQKEILERAGYTVTAKCSSLDALEAFQANPWRFHLIITDQTMPYMTGIELSKEVLRIRSDIPVLLSSGYSKIIEESKSEMAGITACLMKPLLRNELVEVVQKILDEQRTAGSKRPQQEVCHPQRENFLPPKK